MKNPWIFLAVLVLAACSRKTQPGASPATAKNNAVITPWKTVPENRTEVVPPATNATVAPDPFPDPMIVIDANGNIVTSRSQLPPAIAEKTNYRSITRSFTPAQRKNLIYRFQMVPPRVLYVPEKLTQKSARGVYVIFKKKFWYWQKEDGLFYLDETYYQ